MLWRYIVRLQDGVPGLWLLTTNVGEGGAEHAHYKRRLSPELSAKDFRGRGGADLNRLDARFLFFALDDVTVRRTCGDVDEQVFRWGD